MGNCILIGISENSCLENISVSAAPIILVQTTGFAFVGLSKICTFARKKKKKRKIDKTIVLMAPKIFTGQQEPVSPNEP